VLYLVNRSGIRDRVASKRQINIERSLDALSLGEAALTSVTCRSVAYIEFRARGWYGREVSIQSLRQGPCVGSRFAVCTNRTFTRSPSPSRCRSRIIEFALAEPRKRSAATRTCVGQQVACDPACVCKAAGLRPGAALRIVELRACEAVETLVLAAATRTLPLAATSPCGFGVRQRGCRSPSGAARRIIEFCARENVEPLMPPATSTWPLGSNVAVCERRA